MTYRELRQALTLVEDQELTVEELRHKLFELEDQDAEVTEYELYALTEKPKTYKGYTITGNCRDGYEAKDGLVTLYGRTITEVKGLINAGPYHC